MSELQEIYLKNGKSKELIACLQRSTEQDAIKFMKFLLSNNIKLGKEMLDNYTVNNVLLSEYAD